MAAKRTVLYFTIDPELRNRFKAAAALQGKSMRAWALEAMGEKAEREFPAALGTAHNQGQPADDTLEDPLPNAGRTQPGIPAGATEETDTTSDIGDHMKGRVQLQEVLQTLSLHRTELKELGVKSLAVFGSVVRGEARPDSDVDLLVEFDRPTGLFGLLDVKYRLEKILGLRVDLVGRSGVHPALRDRVYAEAVDAL